MTIKISSEIKTQFVRFMMRDGWHHADAVDELNYLMLTDTVLATKDFYVSVPPRL